MFKRSIFFQIICLTMVLTSCVTTRKGGGSDGDDFINGDPSSKLEVFRVLITSDKYVVAQTNFKNSISRVEDAGGDEFFQQELKQYDYINEQREGILTVWLYPDSGKLMQVRPKQLTFLKEIDALLLEDMKRWSFKFPRRIIEPSKFEVHYKVVLQKSLSDEEVQNKILENMDENQ